MGGRKVGELKTRVGRERFIAKKRPDGPGGRVEVYKLEEPDEEDIMLIDVGSS